MKQKRTTLTVDVPYKRAGNVINQQPVTFDVLEEEGRWFLAPHLDEEGLRVANLPPELGFVMENGKPVSLRGPKDGNFHVIEDAVKQLREQNAIA